ncbi:hypothetical protein [Paracoccus aestuariivivens]|uniref:DUF2497 domain-containing protein n=1 Tax=Paracoccus aestuariivivens TaxID=1820333 RepID=A0A6L6J7R8_9RHOB|nr:hypothetical protein [Paracoccus aestuariivivens]MTH78162.1 hypothetical protein [Paracoccus aestuariivivens]
MQRDYISQTGEAADNVGDVLASIRRLIAQDQADRHASSTTYGDTPLPPFSRSAILHSLPVSPLVLAHQDMVSEAMLPADQPALEPNGAMAASEPALTPEEEAEFAEAEAALARMVTASRPTEPEPAPEVEEAQIAQFPVLNLFAAVAPEAVEPSLRDLIREVIREELQSETGLRVSRQLHLLVRQEVETVIRDICTES